MNDESNEINILLGAREAVSMSLRHSLLGFRPELQKDNPGRSTSLELQSNLRFVLRQNDRNMVQESS